MLRISAALLAGGIAIILNTAALGAADWVPLSTAHGGLLRLLGLFFGGWKSPPSHEFQVFFHIIVGLAMAMLYACLLEPRMAGPSWLNGTLYGIFAWLANAVIILPATGEGFAGSINLTLSGMIWFAAAHMLFFVLQAILYARFRANCLIKNSK